MGLPSYIESYHDLATSRLLSQFKDKPVIDALLKTWTDYYQTIEFDLYNLMLGTLFLNTEGMNLSRYGQLLGITQPIGMPSNEFREVLIAEIMKRSSDGTPNRIRQILEATTGITNTRYFEHVNGLQKPYVMGSILIYGYNNSNNNINIQVNGSNQQAKYIKWAAPITTGSCVFGIHSADPSSLFIPTELGITPLTPLYVTNNLTENPTFELDIDGWDVNDTANITYERVFTDETINAHHNGVINIRGSGSKLIRQSIDNLRSDRSYTASIRQDVDDNYDVNTTFLVYEDDGWRINFNRVALVGIPSIIMQAGWVFQCRAYWKQSGGGAFHGINGSVHVNVETGLLTYPMNAFDLYLDGELWDNDRPIESDRWYHVFAVMKGQVTHQGWFGGFSSSSRWSGYIEDYMILDDEGTVQRHYQCTYYQEEQPAANTPVQDLAGGTAGTLTGGNFVRYNVNHTRLMTGNDTATVEFKGSRYTTIQALCLKNDATKDVRLDNIEVISRHEEDLVTLHDQSGNLIAIREDLFNTNLVAGYENAILAEFESQVENFRVESSIAPNDFPAISPNVNGIDNFNIETRGGGVEQMNIEYIGRFGDGSLKPRADRGVMLEISQVNYYEDM